MALRSLLSKYKSISRPSAFSGGSSSYSSLIKRQLSAEDAIIDDQYEQGNLSAESYLSKLTERLSRIGLTPLQSQTLTEKARNVQVDVVDAAYSNAYQRGDILTRDMFDYEKAKLDKMTEPGSQAYLKQEQKVQGLLDKSEREDRSDFRRQKMLEISKMPEDTSEKMWQKAQLYDQLEQQARADGDNETADSIATQKNNYTNSAKRGDINDFITNTKLQVSETFGAGMGVPSAEGGAGLYAELTGGGTPGISSPAVKNALESLDRQKMTLDRLYQSRSDKENMIQTYQQAIAAASGDQKTQLTIAFNNLQSDITGIDNQIANTTQNITDQIYKVQEINQRAAASSFNQEVRKNNSMFNKAEDDLETEFKKGKINKVEYITKGIELAQTKAMFYEQASGGFAQFGNEASADTYMEKTSQAIDIHESLINVAQNLNDYEPVFVDKDSNLTNLFGEKIRKGDVVLQDVRRIKDSGRFKENYADVEGVFHRIQYEGLPPEYLDADGFLMSGLSGDKSISKFLDNAYVYTVTDGKVGTERIKFLQGDDGVKAVTEARANKLVESGAVIRNDQGGLIWKPNIESSNLLKAAAGAQQFARENIKGYDAFEKNIQGVPENLKQIGQKAIVDPVKNVMQYYKSFYSPIVQKGVDTAKSLFEKGKQFASTAISKAQEVFRGMNIFNPPPVGGSGNRDDMKNPYDREIVSVFGEDAQDAMRVLRYTDENGVIKGENTGLKTGTEVDIANRNGSIDRGLYRINSDTFKDFQSRKGALLAQYGIRSWDDMLNPQKNIMMAKIIKDEQGWGAWYAAPPELRSKTGSEPTLYASRQPHDLRTKNIELALGLPEGTYKSGYKPDQTAIDRAYRSNDKSMIQLMKDEGFNQSAPTPTPSPTPTSQPSAQLRSHDSGGGSSWNPPKINIPQMTQNFGQAAQKATSAVKNYFTPEYNAGKNFWSTPTAQRLGDVQQTVQKYTAPIVNRVKSTAGKVKSWFSNLFK